MLTASRSFVRAGRSDAGAALPQIPELSALYSYGFVPRMGQMLMIAGMPGAQKSGLALWLAARWGLPCLYFAADMDEVDATMRLASHLTGHTMTEVEQGMEQGEHEFYAERLDALPVQFCYDGVPSLEDVKEELDAYVELWDTYPSVMVFDNLLNLESDGDKNALTFLLTELKSLAKITNAAVVVLHHMSESNQRNPYEPCARRDLQQKVAELPQRILSIAVNPQTGEMKMAAVKNRNGPSDVNAERPFSFRARPEVNRFEIWVPGLSSYNGSGWQE